MIGTCRNSIWRHDRGATDAHEGRSALTGSTSNRLGIEECDHPSIDCEPSETPELAKPFDNSFPRHSGPLGELLLVDGGIDFNMFAEWAPVALG